jgi:hypothetical protein
MSEASTEQKIEKIKALLASMEAEIRECREILKEGDQ